MRSLSFKYQNINKHRRKLLTNVQYFIHKRNDMRWEIVWLITLMWICAGVYILAIIAHPSGGGTVEWQNRAAIRTGGKIRRWGREKEKEKGGKKGEITKFHSRAENADFYWYKNRAVLLVISSEGGWQQHILKVVRIYTPGFLSCVWPCRLLKVGQVALNLDYELKHRDQWK